MIGPNFYFELINAGLIGLKFSWGSDGQITYDPSLTAEQRTAIQNLVAAHVPRALTAEELAILKTAAAGTIVNGTSIQDALKAFALVVLDEINILRGQHALTPRTAAQLKQAIINKLPDA